MINLEPKHLMLLKKILKDHVPNYSVYLFGSRTSQNIKPYSDIDLVIKTDENIPISTMASMCNAFEDSELPYKVDVLEWNLLDKSFQKNIQNHLVLVQAALNK
jgi:hypothetical protein